MSWRWLPESPQTRLTYEFEGAVGDELGLPTMVMIEVFAEDPSAAGARDPQITLRRSVRFTPIERATDGMSLCAADIVTSVRGDGGEFKDLWAVVVVQPLSDSAGLASEQLKVMRVAASAENGWKIGVQDGRFDLGCRLNALGSDAALNLDGRIVELPAPLHFDAGLSLPAALEGLSLPLTNDGVPERASGEVDDSVGERSSPSSAGASSSKADLGDFDYRGGPIELSHSFVVRNDKDEPLRVEDVVRTCGWLRCEIHPETIAPGGEAVVSIAMTISSPGIHEQSAVVRFEDGSMQRFELRARAVAAGSLRGTVHLAESGTEDTFERVATLNWLETPPHATPDSLMAHELTLRLERAPGREEIPPGGVMPIRLIGMDWTEIERGSLGSRRPTRFVGTATFEWLATSPSPEWTRWRDEFLRAPRSRDEHGAAITLETATGRRIAIPVSALRPPSRAPTLAPPAADIRPQP